MSDHKFMKRITPFLVLELLRAYTDEEQGLGVNELVELLDRDYSITMERKTVSRILNDLLELSRIPQNYDWRYPMAFSVRCDTTKRRTGDIKENWRLSRRL